ncbi:50S ribosomal protein L33 [Atopobacter sp. AH10]|uniref:50S ribosomal protein L33 n=1 Tax=Atopobacter sp. AH10 TaxID=2315861 RepID=UPI000EF188F8|nr:50S ribosomal protein L33 [Atopobacter sp. AH10]RLK62795.1 50S ribosomal protein L33 [Atopobacter sp. AH10]
MVKKKKTGLACTVCGSRNYTIHPSDHRQERIEINKFCRYCGKHTPHKETK